MKRIMAVLIVAVLLGGCVSINENVTDEELRDIIQDQRVVLTMVSVGYVLLLGAWIADEAWGSDISLSDLD